jgi:hypothetical protein
MELFCTEHSKPLEPVFEFHMAKIHYFCPECDRCLVSRDITPEEKSVAKDCLGIGRRDTAHKLEERKACTVASNSSGPVVSGCCAPPALNNDRGPEISYKDLDHLVNCEPAVNALRMLLLEKKYMDDYEACDPKIWSDGDVVAILFQSAVDDYGFDYEKFLEGVAE